jgi:broad specificity phosphatase PhoE
VEIPLDVVLVRHGESEGYEAVRRERAGDPSLLMRLRERHSSFWRLTEQGIAQAERSGAWLREAFPDGFDRYYTSEYVRAMETAARLSLPRAEWVLHPALRERSWGDLDRLTEHERHERYAAELSDKAMSPFYWRPPNGESIAEVSARLLGLLDRLRRECSSGRALLVCHGELIGAFRARLEDMSQRDFLSWSTDPREKIANGEIVHYTRRDPHTGEATEELTWRRTAVPHDESRSQPWQRIESRRYDAEGLLAAVEETARLTS